MITPLWLYRLTRKLRTRKATRSTTQHLDALSREWAALTQQRDCPGCWRPR